MSDETDSPIEPELQTADQADKDPSAAVPAVPPPTPMLRDGLQMQCDSCFLADRGCPMYQPGLDCRMDFNGLFRDNDRETAVKESVYQLLELQMERVTRGAAIERTNQGILDPILSAEIERYFQILKQTKELGEKEASDSLTIHAKGKAASPGMLRSLLE